MTPNEMSLDQCRDWLAREDGWVTEQDHAIQKDGTLRPLIAWTHKATNREKIWVHPYPTTIDGAAGAMPEGWEIEISQHALRGSWWACADRVVNHYRKMQTLVAPTELLARYRLAVAVRIAMKETV